MDHDLMRSVMRPAAEPNRAEREAENFERNIRQQESQRARFELEDLRRKVWGWALEHQAELSPGAMKDLFERIGLRVKP